MQKLISYSIQDEVNPWLVRVCDQSIYRDLLKCFHFIVQSRK